MLTDNNLIRLEVNNKKINLKTVHNSEMQYNSQFSIIPINTLMRLTD